MYLQLYNLKNGAVEKSRFLGRTLINPGNNFRFFSLMAK